MLTLPPLTWIPSPNFSSRGGQKVRLVVAHLTVSPTAAGTVSWFSQARSQVSAHVVTDGKSAVQMVAWANKAWHVCDFNPVSEGIETVGMTDKDVSQPEWESLANIVACRLKANGLPPAYAHGGEGAGYCQHRDLGQAGGGHSDITADPALIAAFQSMVEAAYPEAPDAWTASAPNPHPHDGPAHDLVHGSMEWAQASLNALGASPTLAVDGMDGPATHAAISRFQAGHGCAIDGTLGPETIAAIDKALAAN